MVLAEGLELPGYPSGQITAVPSSGRKKQLPNLFWERSGTPEKGVHRLLPSGYSDKKLLSIKGVPNYGGNPQLKKQTKPLPEKKRKKLSLRTNENGNEVWYS